MLFNYRARGSCNLRECGTHLDALHALLNCRFDRVALSSLLGHVGHAHLGCAFRHNNVDLTHSSFHIAD